MSNNVSQHNLSDVTNFFVVYWLHFNYVTLCHTRWDDCHKWWTGNEREEQSCGHFKLLTQNSFGQR